MKFRLIKRDDSRYGDDYYNDFNTTIPGAFRETEWKPEGWRNEGCTIKHCAVLNEQGKPVIVVDRIDFKPEKAWFKEGRNHHQVERYLWRREVERGYIYINLNTLEDLIAFMRQYNADLEVEDDCTTLTGYYPPADG